MSVKRHLAVARRASRGLAPGRKYGLGSRVAADREPKLLRESTRLAAARTQVAPVAKVDVLAAPAPVSFPPARFEQFAPAPAPALMRAPAPAPRSTPAPGPRAPREEAAGSMLKFLPEQPVEPSARPQPASAQPPRPTLSRAPRSTPASPTTPAPLSTAASPATRAPVSTPASPASPGISEETGNYSEYLPTRSTESPASPRLMLARAPAPGPSQAPPQSAPRPLSRSAESAPAPAAGPRVITPESLGIGPASFEWLFGDPDKALAHPDVTAGPVVSLPPLTPQQRSARRVARLAARGGSPYGRGARISEGPAKAPEPTAPVVHVESAVAPDRAGPQLPAPSAVAEAPAAAVQRVAREEAPERHPAPAPPSPPASNATPPEPGATPPASGATPPAPPRPARQRLVAGRRPVTGPGRELARAAVDPLPAPSSQPAPAPTEQPVTPPTPAAAPPPRTPPPPPSPGPPPVRPMAPSPPARTTRARPQIVRRQPAPPARPTIHRAPRPAPAAPPAPASAPQQRTPSVFRRALAALTHRPQPGQPPADGAGPAKYAGPAPSARAVRPVARMARPERPSPPPVARMARPQRPPARTVARMTTEPPTEPSPQPWTRPDDVAPRALSPQPPMQAPAEPSSQQVSRAPAPGVSPKSHATPPSAPTDPDLAYRDLLTRVREEREQLGQLISHPF
jgi:hypothetical protein